MATFTNHVTLHGTANGTTSHTVNPASGTVLAGSAFTPTAGRLLVVIAYGSVTSTTPSGWTLEASAINSGGLYIWSRTAAGSDTFSTTHNGSNYECIFTILEFPAGSTYFSDITATNTTDTGANPNLTGLTGTKWVAGAKALNTNAATSGVWTSPVVELCDSSQVSAPTDGCWLSVGYVEDSVAASFQPTCTRSGGVGTSESATFAVTVATGSQSRTADTAATTLAGQQATLAGSGSVSRTSDVASTVLTGQTPAAAGSGSVLIPVDTANLALSGQDIIASTGAVILLEGQTPTLTATGSAPIVADPATATLAGQTPAMAGTGSTSVATDTASLGLSGQQASLVPDTTVVSADTAALALNGQQATLSGSGSAQSVVDVASLSVSGQQAALNADAASIPAEAALLALPTTTPGLEADAVSVETEPALVELSAATPIVIVEGEPISVGADTAVLVLTAEDSEGSGSGGITLVGDAGALSLVGQTPSALPGVLAEADPALLALAGLQATLVGGNVTMPADPASLILMGQTPAATSGSAEVSVLPALLTLTGRTPSLVDASVPPLPDDGVALVLRLTIDDATLVLDAGPVRDLEMRR